jgi:hypothetical protein
MVVGQEMTEAQPLDRLRVITQGDGVIAKLRLRKDNTDTHGYS